MSTKQGHLYYITGQPGTGIENAINKYLHWLTVSQNISSDSLPKIVKLENYIHEAAAEPVRSILKKNDYIPTWWEFLDLPRPVLIELWKNSFISALNKANEHKNNGFDVIFTFHASWYHPSDNEFITVVDFNSLLQADATCRHFITLVDDIYDVRQRLSNKALGLYSRPWIQGSEILDIILKLNNTLNWRSLEIMLSQRISSLVKAKAHFVLSVKHQISVFHKVITTELPAFYLSHPISSPRRLSTGSKNDKMLSNKIIDEINNITRYLSEFGIVFEPASIDEYRLEQHNVKSGQESKKIILPKLNPRWKLLYNAEDQLFSPHDQINSEFGNEWGIKSNALSKKLKNNTPLDEKDLKDLESVDLAVRLLGENIKDQLASRDYRLIEQAGYLAVYRPFFLGHGSKGVRRELEYCTKLIRSRQFDIKVFILHTPDDERDRILKEVIGNLFQEWNSKGFVDGITEKNAEIIQEINVTNLQSIKNELEIGKYFNDILKRKSNKFNFEFPTDDPLGGKSPVKEEEFLSQRGRDFIDRDNESNYLRELEGNNFIVIRELLTPQQFAMRLSNISQKIN